MLEVHRKYQIGSDLSIPDDNKNVNNTLSKSRRQWSVELQSYRVAKLVRRSRSTWIKEIPKAVSEKPRKRSGLVAWSRTFYGVVNLMARDGPIT
jgi:hypothetical protein